jgi:hypothetical protein
MADSTQDETKALWAALARVLAAMTVPELKALLRSIEEDAARRGHGAGRNDPGRPARKRRQVR